MYGVRLINAFLLSRLDYSNAILVGLPMSTLVPLQRVLHAASHTVLNLNSYIFCMVLRELHCEDKLYTTHVSATLRSICHSCWRQSLTLYRAQLFSRGQTLMLTFHHCSKRFVRELFHCHIWCVTSGQLTLRTRGHISKLFRKILARFPTSSNDEKFAASQLSNTWLYYRVWVISANKCQGLLFQD